MSEKSNTELTTTLIIGGLIVASWFFFPNCGGGGNRYMPGYEMDEDAYEESIDELASEIGGYRRQRTASDRIYTRSSVSVLFPHIAA